MPTDFIFMLTQNDRTVPNALNHARVAIAEDIKHIGFKDVGISFQEMKTLTQVLKSAQVGTYLEVVSLDAQSELQSAEMALELQVDYLLGGIRPHLIAPMVRNHAIKYFPFIGHIQGHPSQLKGTIPEITDQARKVSAMEGVDGLDLLAYRFKGDVPSLIYQVKQASLKPIIVAGSINNQERIEVVKKAGVKGFTVGTAVFEGQFDKQRKGLQLQLEAVLRMSNI